MAPFCEDHREDWELFALGSLDEARSEEMSAHLESGCRDCAEFYRAAESSVAAIKTLPVPVQPSRELDMQVATRARGNFWTTAPWVLAVLFSVLFVMAERAYLTIKRDWATLQPLSATTTQNERPIITRPDTFGEEDVKDMRATIDQLRQSVDQANEEAGTAQREAARLESELNSVNLEVAALQNSLKGAEERRVIAESQASAIHAQLAQAEDDARRAHLLSTQNQQMVRLLESTSLHQLSLKAVSPLAGEANARVVWDNDRGLMLLAHNLPELPDNRVFQLWILRKGNPAIVSAGVVQTDVQGRGTVFVAPGEDLNDMAGVVVTDEPAGGSTSSRGSQVLEGKP